MLVEIAKMGDTTRWLTIRQAAAAGPLSEHELRLRLRQGRLPGVFVGETRKHFRVQYEQLIRQLEEDAGEVKS